MSIHSYDHPALTADVALFALGNHELKVLLIRRAQPPFQETWAFPGGFVDVGEAPEEAASRELEEETGVRDVELQQLRAFGAPHRDPRGHVVTLMYLGVVANAGARSPHALPTVQAGSDAGEARWWSIDDLPPLAFDHDRVLAYALRRLRSDLMYAGVDHDLAYSLPDTVTVGDLRAARQAIASRLGET